MAFDSYLITAAASEAVEAVLSVRILSKTTPPLPFHGKFAQIRKRKPKAFNNFFRSIASLAF